MTPNRKRTVTFGKVIKRRTFLKVGAGATALLSAPAILRARNLNEKLNVAVIGCGGRGRSNLDAVAAEGENIVALCDVNETNLNAASERHP